MMVSLYCGSKKKKKHISLNVFTTVDYRHVKEISRNQGLPLSQWKLLMLLQISHIPKRHNEE